MVEEALDMVILGSKCIVCGSEKLPRLKDSEGNDTDEFLYRKEVDKVIKEVYCSPQCSTMAHEIERKKK